MPDKGPLLALDTSTPTARLAVVSAGGVVLASAEKTAARQSANLLRLCDETLRAAGVSVAGLGAIACGAGPGSFTGLRVGFAVAKGLALPTGLPLVLVSSLEALAHDLDGPAGALLVPCLDAGKDQVYARLFRDGQPIGDEWAIAPGGLIDRVREAAPGAPVLIGGTGLDRYQAIFTEAFGPAALRLAAPGPSALAVATLARARLARGEHDDLAQAVPSYGRAPDITRPRPRTRGGGG